eukprot:s2574_g10.t1
MPDCDESDASAEVESWHDIQRRSGILSFTFRSSLSAVADVDLLPGPKGPQGRQKLKSGPLQAGQTGQIKKLWRYSSHLWRFDPLQDSSHKGTDHDLGIGARLHFSA